jgi:hypothetical protein
MSTQMLEVSFARLTRGSMLEVSRDAAAAGEEQLASCAAERGKYIALSVQLPLAFTAIYLERITHQSAVSLYPELIRKCIKISPDP